MRTKLMLPTLTSALAIGLATVFVLAGIPSSSGNAQDAYEERISALETRVAVLEEEVGIAETTSGTAQSNQTSQQSRVSTSSSQTNVSRSSSAGSYSASFTSSGDNTFEIEIDQSGTYTLAITAGSPFEVNLLDADGESVSAFSLSSDESGSMTVTGELQPDLYTLRVKAESMWNVTMLSSDT